jgi:hypothetical protein
MTPYPSDSPDGASDGASESVTAQTLMSSITYDAEASFYAYPGPAFSG